MLKHKRTNSLESLQNHEGNAEQKKESSERVKKKAKKQISHIFLPPAKEISEQFSRQQKHTETEREKGKATIRIWKQQSSLLRPTV